MRATEWRRSCRVSPMLVARRSVLAVDPAEQVQRLGDPTRLADGTAEAGGSAAALQDAQQLGRADGPGRERVRDAEDVLPLFDDHVRVGAVASESVQRSVVGVATVGSSLRRGQDIDRHGPSAPTARRRGHDSPARPTAGLPSALTAGAGRGGPDAHRTITGCKEYLVANVTRELGAGDMTDAFSEYVALLDDVDQIPVAARELPTLSDKQRAVTMAQVVELVRRRVLPQSDREQAGLEALFDDRFAALGHARGASGGTGDHDAIIASVDELARVDPRDAVGVQQLLYRLHAAIAGHFGEAELMLASAVVDEPLPLSRVSVAAGAHSVSDMGDREYDGPSYWFG